MSRIHRLRSSRHLTEDGRFRTAEKAVWQTNRTCYRERMPVSTDPVTEADILTAVVAPDRADLSAESARAILELRFQRPALERMNDLAEKNRDGALSEAERGELESCMRVGNFLNLIQAKARVSLPGVG